MRVKAAAPGPLPMILDMRGWWECARASEEGEGGGYEGSLSPDARAGARHQIALLAADGRGRRGLHTARARQVRRTNRANAACGSTATIHGTPAQLGRCHPWKGWGGRGEREASGKRKSHTTCKRRAARLMLACGSARQNADACKRARARAANISGTAKDRPREGGGGALFVFATTCCLGWLAWLEWQPQH
jgi:hypothetical protein